MPGPVAGGRGDRNPVTYNRYSPASTVTDLIGNTPLLKLQRIPEKGHAQILCKLDRKSVV